MNRDNKVNILGIFSNLHLNNQNIQNLNKSFDSEEKREQQKKLDPSKNYSNFQIKKGDMDDYEVETKIGRGHYSEVFEGRNILTKQKVIVKILKPIKMLKIQREIKILTYLKNCPNIVQLVDVVKDKESQIYCLIYGSTQSYEMKRISYKIKDSDLRLYMYKILKCLEYTHSHGIMHRDIKPGNVVINTLTKELRVIDWGLAEFYSKGFEYNLRVSSRFYKAPELLLHYKKYDYSIDMWSLGCLFAAVLFQKDYFFKGDDLNDQIVKIVSVLGYDGIEEFTDIYEDSYVDRKVIGIIKKFHRKKWDEFINDKNKYLINDDSIDLLNKLLEYCPDKRITAKDALKHPYFKNIVLEDENNINGNDDCNSNIFNIKTIKDN